MGRRLDQLDGFVELVPSSIDVDLKASVSRCIRLILRQLIDKLLCLVQCLLVPRHVIAQQTFRELTQIHRTTVERLQVPRALRELIQLTIDGKGFGPVAARFLEVSEKQPVGRWRGFSPPSASRTSMARLRSPTVRCASSTRASVRKSSGSSRAVESVSRRAGGLQNRQRPVNPFVCRSTTPAPAPAYVSPRRPLLGRRAARPTLEDGTQLCLDFVRLTGLNKEARRAVHDGQVVGWVADRLFIPCPSPASTTFPFVPALLAS